MKHGLAHLPLFLLALGLAACGGGGSGGSPDPTDPITITGDNAADVSAVVIDGISAAGDAGDLVIDDVVTGVVIEADHDTDPATVAIRIAAWARERSGAAVDEIVTGAIVEIGLDCTGGGTVTFRTDTGLLSEAEYFDSLENFGIVPANTSDEIIFNNCNEPGLGIVDGSLKITYLEDFPVDLVIGVDVFTIDWLIEFDRFEVVGESEIDGDLLLLIVSGTGGALEVEVSGEALESADGSRTTTLIDYLTTSSDDGTAADFIVDTVDMTFVDTELGGSVDIETLAPIITLKVDEWPESGALKVTGAGNTSVTLTALDNTNVRLSVDSDGDGVVNVTIDMTWEALDALSGPLS